MRTQFRKSVIRFTWIITLSSCLSPIDFSTENIGDRLVVSGQVSTLADQNFIQLGTTANTERLPIPLSGASVVLFDDTGSTYAYLEDSYNPGTYLLQDVAGIPTKSYHIQIITPTGETYESAPEQMPEAAGELATSYEFVRENFTDTEGIISEQPFMKIYTNSLLPYSSGLVFVKWSVEEAFLITPTDFPDISGYVPPPCYVVQDADPQRITLFNGEDVKANSVENLLTASRIIDWSFLEKHYFTIYQSSLTRESYEYWRKVNILANQVGSIFDTPPAEITGNIRNINSPSEKVLGYFQASNQVFDRIYVGKSDLPFVLNASNCNFDNRDSYPQRCLDCLSVRNSSYRRPIWF